MIEPSVTSSRAGARRPGARRVALAAAAVLVVSSCGGGDESPTSSPSTSSAPPPAPLPLRGTPADDPAVASRPALVVKIDNNDEHARPQEGLGDADVIIEEKVEGPFSRFAAVFHARQPHAVGPVRSGRTTDIAIVASLNRPLFAFSGANPSFLTRLRAAPLVDLGAEAVPDAYERRQDRQAPYNLWVFPDRLRAEEPPGSKPPPPAFSFSDAPPAGDSVPAASASYDFGPGGIRVGFAWDEAARGWARTQNGTRHVDVDGVGLTPANVVIQLVAYLDTGERDSRGTPVPEAQLMGEGEAWVLTRGVAVRARWNRSQPDRPTDYRSGSGEPVALAPGQTWVALVPQTGASHTITGADGSLVP